VLVKERELIVTARAEQLARNWTQAKTDVQLACEQVNRTFADVTIIAVTKTWPAIDVDTLAECGVTDVGENRDQEAAAKHQQVRDSNLTWHAIGQVQTNKVKSIVQWADVIHSVDRLDLVRALAKVMPNREKPLGVFIQLNLDPEIREARGGLRGDNLLTMAEAITDVPGLQVRGVMGVAPLVGEPEAAFASLQEASTRLQTRFPQACDISAGMSGDYKIALKYGATHLRLGSLILGNR